ncbi:Vacuolar ABC heavy metal transporter (H.t1.c1) [Penicillium longicatenatum]|uniref:Vacuolar ABC heavy metal transporter (H.t1.c1) n=1 Tax=Penicillium longicatenatum TaxID=1561947 RepID=UPI002548B575|nr:Vacuolar ABC heavy metal transporter (H.t1.c1) [Penicillium longicatenatum]KAJ5640308.1 Vacuolar ABC heavy metal transporter (H.t1.c1) [Penicillium longicatenatum]
MEPQSTHELFESLRVFYPILLIFVFVFVSMVEPIVAIKRAKKNNHGSGPDTCLCHENRKWMALKGHFIRLSAVVLMTYVADMLTYIIHVEVAWSEHWWGGESMAVCLQETCTLFVCLIAAIPIELGILATSLSRYTSRHREPMTGDPYGGPVRESITGWEMIEVTSHSVRILALLALALLYACKCISFTRLHLPETTRLLQSTFDNNHCCDLASSRWWENISFYAPFWPCIWPSKSRHLQSILAACAILIVLQVWVKAVSHSQVGVIITALKIQNGADTISIPRPEVKLWIVYYILSQSLNILRSWLWIPVSQHTYRRLSITGLGHALCLDLEYHQAKSTGELASALNKVKSVTEFQEQISNELLPAILELVFAIGYFLINFDAYYALIIGLYSVIFLLVIARMTQWKAEAKRELTKASKEEEAIKTELIASHKYVRLSCEERETDRYARAVERTTNCQLVTKNRGIVQNILQSIVLTALFLSICYNALYQVSIGLRPVGEFVQVFTYISQLLIPLSTFTRLYDSFQTAMINAERMLEVLRAQPMVVYERRDIPRGICIGKIEFRNVTFFRDGHCLLKGLTFVCEPGTTTALVGESGSGKSTIFDLISGFHHFEGTITIDGEDIRKYDFRKHMTVMSQDSPLLNDTYFHNLTSGKYDATIEEVTEACRDAAILDKINQVPGGFDAKVGANGTKLSGGQKQRLAVARALVPKQTKIRLFDEVTSALDPASEFRVQTSITETSSCHTTIITTHRLKNIMKAPLILVLKDGSIVERGTHEELVNLGGEYALMWRQEQKSYVSEDVELRREEPQ